MVRYISVDSGKFATKVEEYNPKTKEITQFPLRTKVSDGDFRDDAIEPNTVIVKIGDQVLKVGDGARGDGAELNTDKKTDIHKICVLTALATLASAKEVDEMHVVVGAPAADWAHVPTRCDYKDFMLPEGEVNISIKTGSTAPVVEKKFIIAKDHRYVLPESMGALYMDNTIEKTIKAAEDNIPTAILDIGNLNLNATLWQGSRYETDRSCTAELGGAILIREISQELSANIATCDDMIAAAILKSPEHILPGNFSKEKQDMASEIVNKVIRSHVEKIKRCCRSKGWSLDMMNILAIGGTSATIKNELMEAFGENLTVLDNATYCNALGFLRIMCSKETELNEIIPYNFKQKKG